MQTVSQKWLDNHKKTILDESFVEVSIDISDPSALADVSAEDNGSLYISNTEQIASEVDRNIVSYATLEQNMWLLDGSRNIIPMSDYGDNGYISNVLSDENGYFVNKPTITLNFTEVHENIIPGITVTWGIGYDEYPTSFSVTAYNGDTVVATMNISNNNVMKTLVFVDIENYDKIVIEVGRWCLPYHRARIADIFVGIRKVYDKSELFSYSHNQSVDPISTTLPKIDISFAVSNVDDSYNPYNNEGLSKYLIERQAVKTRYGYKVSDTEIEWIKGGTFYLSTWEAPQGGMSANFKARDLLEFMSDTFYEGVYNASGTSLYDLAIQVLMKANLPLNSDGSVMWVIDDVLKDIYTAAPLPVDTLANCLQLIANAGECVIYQDRQGVLHIERISNTVTDYKINSFNSFSKSEISLSKPIKQIDVTMYQFSLGDTTELYKGSISVNGTSDIVIVYSSPAQNVECTISDGTLNSATYYTGACILNVTAEGDVSIVLNGNTLETSTSVMSTIYSTQGETVKVDNPLITSTERARSIGTWVLDYMKNRTSLSSSWRVDPRLDVLDIVTNENEYGTSTERMYEVRFDYNGAFTGTGKGKVI